MQLQEPLSFHLGLDGFVWWLGVIESLADDPLQLGRAKVRIIGWHGTKEEISANQLPWSLPLNPVDGSRGTPTYQTGDWVIGFFLDGKLGQQPMICWVVPSIVQAGGLYGPATTNTTPTKADSSI
jgi:hypothetical protein